MEELHLDLLAHQIFSWIDEVQYELTCTRGWCLIWKSSISFNLCPRFFRMVEINLVGCMRQKASQVDV